MTDVIIRNERYIRFNVLVMLFGVVELAIFALNLQNLEPISDAIVRMSLPLSMVYITTGYVGLHVHRGRTLVVALDILAFLLIGAHYLL